MLPSLHRHIRSAIPKPGFQRTWQVGSGSNCNDVKTVGNWIYSTTGRCRENPLTSQHHASCPSSRMDSAPRSLVFQQLIVVSPSTALSCVLQMNLRPCHASRYELLSTCAWRFSWSRFVVLRLLRIDCKRFLRLAIQRIHLEISVAVSRWPSALVVRDSSVSLLSNNR